MSRPKRRATAAPGKSARATTRKPPNPRATERLPATGEAGYAGTPGAMLREVLDQRGESYTAFAERIGKRYHNVVRWMNNREFTPEHKGRCVVALGLKRGHFGEDTVTRQHGEPLLDQWLRSSPNARALSRADIAVMRSVRFEDPKLQPSEAFYDGLAYALTGAIRVDELLTFEDDNRALSDSLAHKPPLKKR